MAIDTSRLPREIRDRIDLKIETNPTAYRMTEEDYTDEMMSVLEERKKPGSNHSFIASMYGMQGSGKSYAAITLAAILDPNFSVDNIYFDYRDLINNRKALKPGTAVIVDEQSEEFGVDSNRINIILGALKEQLRKKSIHFIFCAPTLKPEYQSSMYVLETMFIDYETKTAYAAYMTRDLLVLGYVQVPHPLNFISEEFLQKYEEKKDAHLDRLTGTKQEDEIEDWAEKVETNELFQRAESFYVKKVGYMPASMVMQIVSKLYPEFKSSVIVAEIAARVKLNKELEGRWRIPYASDKRK